nr:DUF3846 domain-containing protein [Lachnospiraceae bacterium]
RIIKNGEWVTVDNTLHALQHEVGGFIEAIRLFEDTVIIVDEEGKLKGKPISALITRDMIVGDWLVVGCNDEGEFTDLDPRDWENMLAMRVIIPLIQMTVKEPASSAHEIRQEGSDKTNTINIAQDSEGGKPCAI